MSPKDFTAWVAHIKAARGWSARECAKQLGCGVNTIALWSRNGAPLYIGYACAAISYGLPAWTSVKVQS